jgi:hypothetical protein
MLDSGSDLLGVVQSLDDVQRDPGVNVIKPFFFFATAIGSLATFSVYVKLRLQKAI